MRIYRGKSVLEGISIGKIYVYQRKQQKIGHYRVPNTEAEISRFRAAGQKAAEELFALYEKAVKEVGAADAAIFEMHRLLLTDEHYVGTVEKIIRTQKVNAEFAVAAAGDSISSMFADMEDDYIRNREADLQDVSRRVLAALAGGRAPLLPAGEPVIVLAEDLAPSETVQMDKNSVLAFVTLTGSENSHTAILARTMGIPAIVGLKLQEDDSLQAFCGRTAIVDGVEGCFYIDPDEETLEHMRAAQEAVREKKALLSAFKGKESVTLDGRRISLYANIGSDKDLPYVLENDAEGIGLFRSEFLYLEKDDYPTEEEQFAIYRKTAEAMAGKRVIIRTLDVGADKRADYFKLEKEANPAMGFRAIRVSLSRPEIFKTQLRALFRAGAYGRLAIMYPMITSVNEVKKIRAIAQQVQEELKSEGIPFGNVEQGIMIETPAAVMISDLLAKEVDFFSIGTNDLTQYTLAIDRQDQRLKDFFDPRHKGVLRMIAQTVENAHRAGIWCGICGELGADRELTELFLALGIDELSVSSASLLPLRKTVRETCISGREEEIRKRWLD